MINLNQIGLYEIHTVHVWFIQYEKKIRRVLISFNVTDHVSIQTTEHYKHYENQRCFCRSKFIIFTVVCNLLSM